MFPPSAESGKFYLGEETHDGDTFETLDPGKGERLALVAAGDANDVDVAVRAAREAFASGRWSGLRANERAVILHRLADLIDKHSDTLSEIESLDVGKPRTQAQAFDIPHSAKTFRYYADLSVQTRRSEPIAVTGNDARSVSQPCGVCGFIFPWNFPFLLLSWGVAPALAAGNTVVAKPAEDTPLSALYFARLAEEAGFPAGVFNVVTGFGETAGAALAKHPGLDRMSFTGSTEVGRLVAEACGRNLIPVKLELGGKGAAVLFDDIAVEQAADALVGAVTLNAGQVCCTATRWLVHESIKDRFIAKEVSLMGDVRIGYGGDSNSQLGPVVSDKQRKRVLSFAFAPDGSLVFTDPGTYNPAAPDRSYIHRILPDGAAKVVIAFPDPVFPNGVAVEADGSIVWGESYTGHVRRRRPNGMIEDFGRLPGANPVPDGMKIGADARLYVADFMGGGVHVLASNGKHEEFIRCGVATTNCAFDGESLWITDPGLNSLATEATSKGCLWRLRIPGGGAPIYKGRLGELI